MRIPSIATGGASEFARVSPSNISSPGAVAVVNRASSAINGEFQVIRGGGSDALKKLTELAGMSAATANQELEEMANRQRQDVQDKQLQRSQDTTIERIRDSFDAAANNLEGQDKLDN